METVSGGYWSVAPFLRDFNLHLFDVPGFSKSVIRSKYDATQIRSRRVRNEKESAALREYGSCIKIYELQGEVTFTSAGSCCARYYEIS